MLVKMQELESALQTANRVRTELYSMIASLPDGTRFIKTEIPLAFYDNENMIIWGENCKCFTPSTFRLVQELWFAPDRTLSKDGVRHDVKDDDAATDGALWTHVSRAREELQSADFPYEIETLRGKGYRLACL